MRVDTGHDRTVRLLTAQLEAIAAASELLPAGAASYASPKLEQYVQRAAAATRNAVSLELITDEEASDIWAAVMRRHPDALHRAGWPSLAA
jgi:hypothetical protein